MKIDPRIRQMARERVAKDCAERGVPVKIQDPTIYAALARLVGSPVDLDPVGVEGAPAPDGVRVDLNGVDEQPDKLARPLVSPLVPERLQMVVGKDADEHPGTSTLDELILEGPRRVGTLLLGSDKLGGR